MQVLILGGTQFVGRYIVEALLDAGHQVSILTRGQSPDTLPSAVERLRGDRDAGPAGLHALTGRAWDVCIDVSGYTARQVRPSAEQLRDRVRRYIYISAVAVYGDTQARPVVETHPRIAPVSEEVTEIDAETYGRLKVTCENMIHEIYDARCTFLRPQIVVGPGDNWDRYTYWLDRAARDGEMLAPGDGSDHVQFIDVRDVARFVVQVVENDLSGPFNLSGPRMTWAEFINLLGAKNVVWVPAEIIRAAGVIESELPLYRTERGPKSGLMDVSNDRARAAGLTLTDPQVTLRDTRATLQSRDVSQLLSPEREAALIAQARLLKR